MHVIGLKKKRELIKIAYLDECFFSILHCKSCTVGPKIKYVTRKKINKISSLKLVGKIRHKNYSQKIAYCEHQPRPQANGELKITVLTGYSLVANSG